MSVRTISKIHYGGKSQLPVSYIKYGHQCANYFKDTLRRQITTLLLFKCKSPNSVRTISKIHYGGKSQQVNIYLITTDKCANYFKDTLRRQITTSHNHPHPAARVCELFQRYITAANHNNGAVFLSW